MWLPDEIRKCVAFVCKKDQDGNEVPFGTGFFVSVPLEDREWVQCIYFVTARHVVAAINSEYFSVRINKY